MVSYYLIKVMGLGDTARERVEVGDGGPRRLRRYTWMRIWFGARRSWESRRFENFALDSVNCSTEGGGWWEWSGGTR